MWISILTLVWKSSARNWWHWLHESTPLKTSSKQSRHPTSHVKDNENQAKLKKVIPTLFSCSVRILAAHAGAIRFPLIPAPCVGLERPPRFPWQRSGAISVQLRSNSRAR